MGRSHPDPRADPPTQAFVRRDDDAPTVQLPQVVPDTARIPTVGNEVTEKPAADGEGDDRPAGGSLLARFLGRRRARRSRHR
jgi:hypothetical protein